MTDPGFTQPSLQFATAGNVGSQSRDQCQFCHQPIGTNYYRVNDAMACPSCVENKRKERAQDAPAAYVRGLAAGVGAALVGMIGYALIAIILQGWVISLMSVGVGLLVATAMIRASKGVGGRRYQIAAVLLTYAAVSTAAIPIWVYFANQHRAQQTEQQKLEAEQRQLERESGQEQQERSHENGDSVASIGAWIGKAALLGLASPFLKLQGDPYWGAMGLLILFFGMRVAWRIAAGHPFEVYGPFDNAPKPSR
jgi:uncharacterized protein (DUF983 family)